MTWLKPPCYLRAYPPAAESAKGDARCQGWGCQRRRRGLRGSLNGVHSGNLSDADGPVKVAGLR
jgi:hypothetical protein